MTTTISNGSVNVVPDLIDGYETRQDSGSVFHDIIGRADQDVSLRAASLRSGRLSMLFKVKADAWAGREVLTSTSVFTLVDSDVPEANMKFVLKSLETVLEDTARHVWFLNLSYQEVAP